MSQKWTNVKDREFSKFVESPVRPDESAIETIRTNVRPYDIFSLITDSGLLAGESYNEIDFGLNGNGIYLLTYINNDISQFQITIEIFNPTSFRLIKRPAQFAMLQENEDFILQENGDKLLIEGLVP